MNERDLGFVLNQVTNTSFWGRQNVCVNKDNFASSGDSEWVAVSLSTRSGSSTLEPLHPQASMGVGYIHVSCLLHAASSELLQA